MEVKIQRRLKELTELYDFYLREYDEKENLNTIDIIEAKLHDLKIQIWLLEDILEEN